MFKVKEKDDHSEVIRLTIRICSTVRANGISTVSSEGSPEGSITLHSGATAEIYYGSPSSLILESYLGKSCKGGRATSQVQVITVRTT
eukprot:574817-Amphidinium_carterae.1